MATSLRAHVGAALRAGVSAQELLEVLEQLLPALGVSRFMEAVAVWRGCLPADGSDGDG